MKRSFVCPEGPPQRLDKLLTAALAEPVGITRSQLKRWIEEGAVQVNGTVVSKAGTLVEGGALIEVLAPERGQEWITPYPYELQVLHEDEDLLVIDKPAQLTMHPGAGNPDRTLANAVIAYLQSKGERPTAARAGIVHRLDRDTSGLVVVAKHPQAHDALARQFAARTVKRAYRALAAAPPRRALFGAGSGTIEGAIGRAPNDRLRMAVVSQGGKPAVTHWSVVQAFPYATLLNVRLETGRTHQIRVHLHAIGSFVLGDPLYRHPLALPTPLARAEQRFGRQALHAYRLGFVHPRSGEEVLYESALPADFEELLSAFEQFTEQLS